MATMRIRKPVNGEKRLLPRWSNQLLAEMLAEIDNNYCDDAEILGVTQVQVMRALATAGVPRDEIREMWLTLFANKGAQERATLLSYYAN